MVRGSAMTGWTGSVPVRGGSLGVFFSMEGPSLPCAGHRRFLNIYRKSIWRGAARVKEKLAGPGGFGPFHIFIRKYLPDFQKLLLFSPKILLYLCTGADGETAGFGRGERR